MNTKIISMGVVKKDDKYYSIANVLVDDNAVYNESNPFNTLTEAVVYTSVAWMLAAKVMTSDNDTKIVEELLSDIKADDGALLT